MYNKILIFFILIATLFSCIKNNCNFQNENKRITFKENIVNISNEVRSNSWVGEEPILVSIKKLTNNEKSSLKDDFYLHEFIEENKTPINTRAKIITKTEFNDFGVFAYYWNKSQAFDSHGQVNLFNNQQVFKSKGFETSKFWPGASYKVRFYAYSPYNSNYTLDKGRLTFNLDNEPWHQQDLLFAISSDVNGLPSRSYIQELNFKHALTGIKFETGKNLIKGIIKEIRFENINFKAVYNFNTKSWGEYRQNNFSCFPNQNITGEEQEYIVLAPQTADEPMLFFIPGELPSNALLKIKYSILGKDFELTSSLSGTNYKEGTIVTYKLSNKSIVQETQFDISINNKNLLDETSGNEPIVLKSEYSGQSNIPIVVNSKKVIKKNQHSVEEQIPWSVEYIENGDVNIGMPAWITGLGENNFAGSCTTQLKITEGNKVSAHVYMSKLQKRGTVKEPFDLSYSYLTKKQKEKKKQNTANCYIVNAPGTYKVPIVYGNAIAWGRINPKSWSNLQVVGVGQEGSWGYKYRLNKFLRHDDHEITAPYIADNGITIKGASILWMDKENLIKDVKLIDNKYFQFTVDKENIDQGNAVILISGRGPYDSQDVIVWSYHIWLTPLDIGADLIYPQGGATVGFLPIPIGWNDRSNSLWEPRDILLRFKQKGTNKTKVIQIKKRGKIGISDKGSCTYYQGGRKDPFPPITASSTINGTKEFVPLYTEGGGTTKVRADNIFGHNLGKAIRNPLMFICADYSRYNTWHEESYYNFWNNDNSGNNPDVTYDAYYSLNKDYTRNTIKTVYDPSPVGFAVPPTGILAKHSSYIRNNGKALGYIDRKDGSPKGIDYSIITWTCNGTTSNAPVNWVFGFWVTILNLNGGNQVQNEFKFDPYGYPIYCAQEEYIPSYW